MKNHFFCQTIPCKQIIFEVLFTDRARLQFEFGAMQTKYVLFQAGENLILFLWNFETNEAFQFFSSFFLDLEEGIGCIHFAWIGCSYKDRLG
jgi:hypothetical protein